MSLLRKVRLRVPAGTAKPGPAIGQVGLHKGSKTSKSKRWLSHLFFYRH